ncbi:hypothetical protein [uncultured Flavobacterium sp.]|uniref:hypothetical protein n=1 Tax=uncultured Flavobacterium sp. TaxID=165435 RepID=UPI0025DC4B1E|nr:hypothetical protein [uncultured Flavobacterium sp.]
MNYVDSREAMRILSIKSKTTLAKLEREGNLKVSRFLGSNRKRYKISDLEKVLRG